MTDRAMLFVDGNNFYHGLRDAGLSAIGDVSLVDHARSAFDAMAADPELEAARVVWGVVEREGWPEFSKRDLHRALAGRTAYRRADSLDAPLAVLEQHGLVRRQAVVGGAGRPTCRYEVRPCPEPSRSARAAS